MASDNTVSLRVTADTSAMTAGLRSAQADLARFDDATRASNRGMVQDAARATREIRTDLARGASMPLRTSTVQLEEQARRVRDMRTELAAPVTMDVQLNTERLAEARQTIVQLRNEERSLLSGFADGVRQSEAELVRGSISIATTMLKIHTAVRLARSAAASTALATAASFKEAALAAASRITPPAAIAAAAVAGTVLTTNWARSETERIVALNESAIRFRTTTEDLGASLRALSAGGVRDSETAFNAFSGAIAQSQDQASEAAAAFRALGLGQLAADTSRTAALRLTVERLRTLPTESARASQIGRLEAERTQLQTDAARPGETDRQRTDRITTGTADIDARIHRLRELATATDAARVANQLFGEDVTRLVQRGGAGVDRAERINSWVTPAASTIRGAREAEEQWAQSSRNIRSWTDDIMSSGSQLAGAFLVSPFSRLRTMVSHDLSTIASTVTGHFEGMRNDIALFWVTLWDTPRTGFSGFFARMNRLRDQTTAAPPPTIGTRSPVEAESRIMDHIAALRRETGRDEADQLRIREEAVRLGYVQAAATDAEVRSVRELVEQREEWAKRLRGAAGPVREDLLRRLDLEHIAKIEKARNEASAKADREAREDLNRLVERDRLETTSVERARSLGLVRANATRAEAAAVADLATAYERVRDRAVAAAAEAAAIPRALNGLAGTVAGISSGMGALSFGPLANIMTGTAAGLLGNTADQLAQMQEIARRRREDAGLRAVEDLRQANALQDMLQMQSLATAHAQELLNIERGMSAETAGQLRRETELNEAWARRRTLVEGLRLPLDEFRESIAQIADLGTRRLLEPILQDRAMAQQFFQIERMLGASSQRFTGDVIDPRTLEGARFEVNRRLQQQQGGDVQERVRRVLEQSAEVQRRQLDEQREIARAIRNLGPLRPANLPN